MPLNTLKKTLSYRPVQLILFCLAAFILYGPIISRSFASDDFLVMKRVALDRVLWIRGFFRPLSDITLFFNYLLGGFDPIGYYIFNILVHGVNSFLLFRFSLKWRWMGGWRTAGTAQTVYAFIAALLFLSYPFHSEAISWILGRACIVASLMGMCALLIMVSDLSLNMRIAGTCLCYFIGLASYESIMVLPLMAFVILYVREGSRRAYYSWAIALGLTLGVHLVIRVLVSGGVAGSYGQTFFRRQFLNYAGNLFRMTGRYFLPPSDDTRRMLLLFGLLLVVLSIAVLIFFKRTRHDHFAKGHFLKLLILLALASVIPALFGVSTRTAESDRFLYFPSLFLCSCVACVLVKIVVTPNRLVLFTAALVAYQIIFLEKNNLNWIKASRMTRDILGAISRQDPHAKIFVINLPDELNGAYIFRMGFNDALVIHGIDTTKVIVVNHLTRDQMLVLPDSLVEEKRGGEVLIAPQATLSREGADPMLLRISGDTAYRVGKADAVLYWNEHRMIKLK